LNTALAIIPALAIALAITLIIIIAAIWIFRGI
jgi:hypothetical protein